MPVVVPVLMAGGSGTRLWPLSREHYPKQFVTLQSGCSLLQATVRRLSALPDMSPALVIGAEPHRFLIAGQLKMIGAHNTPIILEPTPRNTAPAAAVAALWAVKHFGGEALVFLVPADQTVADADAFVASVSDAVATAGKGHIVTFGITPTRPETGFGWMKAGASLADSAAYAVERFIEKPPLETAQTLLDQGGHYWNGGMFLFPAQLLIEEMQRFEPEMLSAARRALEEAAEDGVFLRLQTAAFSECRSDSIDYAVMEKTQHLALVPLNAGWDDVGSWRCLEVLAESDGQGNHQRGDVLTVDSENNLVHAESRLVTLVGMQNHVVVETPDAVLVAPRDRVQDVKAAVQQLKQKGRKEAVEHIRVYRPWGYYETIAAGERFQVKRIVVSPEQKLSLQMHHHRAEHWVVVRGTAMVSCNGTEQLLSENQSTYIPLGATHRLSNPGKLPLELIEIQSGGYLGEDDIVRFEDVYGRQPG